MTAEAVAKWRDELEPWEVALCETVLRRRMARYGYEASGAGRASPRDFLGYLKVLLRMKASRWRAERRDRRRWRSERNPVAARLTSMQRSSEAETVL